VLGREVSANFVKISSLTTQ